MKQTRDRTIGTWWEGSTDKNSGFVPLGTTREDAPTIDIGTNSSIQYEGVASEVCSQQITANPEQQQGLVDNETVTTDLQCGDANSTPVYIKIRRAGNV
ncbi:MAG: hypothetical protein NXI35_34415 [bacterium]|nr:hypothetical protein [bacterium]